MESLILQSEFSHTPNQHTSTAIAATKNRSSAKPAERNGSYCPASSYNRMVLRQSAAAIFVIGLFGSCQSRIKTKEKVQQAIVDRLQTRSGLDMNSLTVTTTSVTFDKNKAYATVAFHPKGDARVNSDMVMRYSLEARDGNWVVVNVGDSQGHSLGQPAAQKRGDLPPGHPPVDESINPHESVPVGKPGTGQPQ